MYISGVRLEAITQGPTNLNTYLRRFTGPDTTSVVLDLRPSTKAPQILTLIWGGLLGLILLEARTHQPRPHKLKGEIMIFDLQKIRAFSKTR